MTIFLLGVLAVAGLVGGLWYLWIWLQADFGETRINLRQCNPLFWYRRWRVRRELRFQQSVESRFAQTKRIVEKPPYRQAVVKFDGERRVRMRGGKGAA